jgi:hypothetical protein
LKLRDSGMIGLAQNQLVLSKSHVTRYAIEVFYGTQYDLYDWLKKDSYVIEKDLYVRI